MNRQQLEHVIRAAALIVGDEIVVIGSQAILAEHPASPPRGGYRSLGTRAGALHPSVEGL